MPLPLFDEEGNEEDIEEEEEIITEEIASLESEKEVETVKISDLSCLFIDDSVDAQLLFKSQMKQIHGIHPGIFGQINPMCNSIQIS